MKSLAVPLGMLIIIILGGGIVWLNTYFSESHILTPEDEKNPGKTVITEKIKTPQWKLCWFSKKVRGTDRRKTAGLCGKVKKIKMNNEGKILFMEIFFPSTGNTVIFSRPEANHRGRWTQRNTTGGWWYLDKIPDTSPPQYKGECQGNDKGDKVRNLYLSLE